MRERAAEANRLQKTLESANIKLGDVATNVLGRSARQMLEGLVAGTADPATLAQFARGRMREKIPQLERALAGHFAAHQRFMVAQQLANIDYLDEAIAQVSSEVAERLAPFETTIDRLDVVPGIGRRTAEILLSEIGTDMSRFPTAGHLASWAGMCPGHRESAGKQHDGKTRKGSPWLREALIEPAAAAGKTKDTYLAARYHRLVRRRGRNKAAVAVGHQILVIVWHLLQLDCPNVDLGSTYFDERDRTATERRLVTDSNNSATPSDSTVPPPDGGERLFQSRPHSGQALSDIHSDTPPARIELLRRASRREREPSSSRRSRATRAPRHRPRQSNLI